MPHSYSPIAGMKTANDFVFAPSQLNPSRGAGIPEYVKVIFFEKQLNPDFAKWKGSMSINLIIASYPNKSIEPTIYFDIAQLCFNPSLKSKVVARGSTYGTHAFPIFISSKL